MPSRAINWEHLVRDLVKRLQHDGSQSRAELQRALGVSQPTVSRIIKKQKGQIIQVGQNPFIQYALKGESAWPIFEIDRSGKISELDELAAIEPHHFFISNNLYSDLPYFLFDLRPSGFLGRLIPALHPELGLPMDIQTWSSSTTLKYLNHAGINSPGNLIIGEAMAQKFVQRSDDANVTPRSKYTTCATHHLTMGVPGSSAAGEQPKFLVTNDHGEHLIVKFSPPTTESVGARISDILICEHLAMTRLRLSGISAAKTEIVREGKRTFLEVERFDRVESKGRQGVVSLGALTAEFVSDANSWSDAAEALANNKTIPLEWATRIRFLDIFGALIANSDRHLFNVSFLSEHGTKLLDLAPVYDMCPMFYAPRGNQIVPCQFVPPIPRKRDGDLWAKALLLAIDFWGEVSNDARISKEFRHYARANKQVIESICSF